MSCKHPIRAYQALTSGAILFQAPANLAHKTIRLPCNQCTGCRLKRARTWATRCMHEAQLHEDNCFVTLTYNDETLPPGATLVYRDWQLFMKRLRKHVRKKIRFYMAGEYGETWGRPHFHAAIFGYDFPDKKYIQTTSAKARIYRSPTLEKIWPHGHSSIGALTYESAAYIARYIMKKITGDKAKKHYEQINTNTGEITNKKPEFNNMSRRPGLAHAWLEKYTADVYPAGLTIQKGGIKTQAPRYYDKWYAKRFPTEYELMKTARELEAINRWRDNTTKRLKAKETVEKARISQLKRTID